MGQRSIRFPDELEARIEARAREEDRSFSYVVLRALEKALDEGSPGKLGAESVAKVPPAPSRASRREEPSVPKIAPRHWAS